MTRHLSAKAASRMLQGIRMLDPVSEQRKLMARTHLGDIRRLDRDIKAKKALVRKAVNATDTTLTNIYGVGPMVAADERSTNPASPSTRNRSRHLRTVLASTWNRCAVAVSVQPSSRTQVTIHRRPSTVSGAFGCWDLARDTSPPWEM
jgi:hypothetical protein